MDVKLGSLATISRMGRRFVIHFMWLLLLLTALLTIPSAKAQSPAVVYPGATWDRADPAASGWSLEKLSSAEQYFRTLATGSLIVVDNGRVVVEWNDPARRVKLSSVRKSFLSALYGIHVRKKGDDST